MMIEKFFLMVLMKKFLIKNILVYKSPSLCWYCQIHSANDCKTKKKDFFLKYKNL